MVEGAPLLRAYMHKMRIEGSNPSLSANKKATFEVAFLLAKGVSASRTRWFDQLGLKSFHAASHVLAGIELMHMIRKGQNPTERLRRDP